MDHREMEFNTAGSLWLRTTFREVHITRAEGAPWWPRREFVSKDEGLLFGFGWQVAYSRTAGAPKRKL